MAEKQFSEAKINFTSYKTKLRVLAVRMFVFSLYTISSLPALRLPLLNKYTYSFQLDLSKLPRAEILVFGLNRLICLLCTKSLAECGGRGCGVGRVRVVACYSLSWFSLLFQLFICQGYAGSYLDLNPCLGISEHLLGSLLITYLLKLFIVSLAKGQGTDIYQFQALAYL